MEAKEYVGKYFKYTNNYLVDYIKITKVKEMPNGIDDVLAIELEIRKDRENAVSIFMDIDESTELIINSCTEIKREEFVEAYNKVKETIKNYMI